MKISHRELELCRAQPTQWLASAATPSTGRKFGYNQALLNAIYQFHRLNGNAKVAQQRLQELISKHLTNQTRIVRIETALDEYISWAKSVKVTVADCRIRIALDVSGFLQLTGEISRLDIVETGYRAVLLGKISSGWASQLRMPLIQKAIAVMYARPIATIEVGCQELDGSGMLCAVYDSAAIESAEMEFRQLGEKVRRYKPPTG